MQLHNGTARVLRFARCRATFAPMQRIYYAAIGIAVLALGLVCCWLGSKQDPKQPHEVPSAVAQQVDPIPEVPEALPAPVIASRDAGTDAGPVVVEQAPLIRRLHILETTDPGLAASLAREDQQRFPNSPHAEERDLLLVTSLHNKGDFAGAKREAWYYFTHYPNGQHTEFLVKLTGLHPPSAQPSR
jgi:hypothetical protein